MRIAVSYELDTENVFDHFGHAEAFKLYDVEDGNIVSTEIVSPNGMGHEVMVGFMAEHKVDTVICGFIGSHALEGLKELGIHTFIAEGNADAAVKAFFNGELKEETEGHACHCHHGHEEPHVLYEGKNAGKKVSVHYRGTLNDGTQFDSSYDRGQTLDFICAIGQMIPGFDKAVVNMEVGEETDIHLMPEEAYGPKNPNAILEVEIAQMPGSEQLNVGNRVYLSNAMGQQIPVTVTNKTDTHITFDANHEMAGKELNFHIELVSVEA